MATSDPHVDVNGDAQTDLKMQQACLKSQVTRVMNKIKVLMKDPDNYELVCDLSRRLEERFEEFMVIQ